VRSDVADNADRPFAALASLLSSVTAAELDAVPPGRRRLLAAVIHGDAEPITMAGVRLAVLNLVRVLAHTGPVLLSVDDLHRLDAASADVLRFVAQRVADLPIVMAAAELVSLDGVPARRPLCPPPLLVVGLDSMTTGLVTLAVPARGGR
jgi:predicted ATPase